MAEHRAQLLAVVGEKLCTVSAALDGGMDHAGVEQVFRDQLGVHMNENAVGSQSWLESLVIPSLAAHSIARAGPMWGAVLGVLPCRWVAECVGNGPPIRAAILFPLAALCGAD